MRASVIFLLISTSSAIAQPYGPSKIYGMLPVNDSTHIDQCEITVAEWIEFMHDQNGYVPEPEALKQLPYAWLFGQPGGYTFRLAWFGQFSSVRIQVPADSLRTRAQRSKAHVLASYPITAIGYAQAKAYCRWRTERCTEVLRSRGETMFSISFELPTASEMDAFLTTVDSTNGTCALFNYNCVPCQVDTKKSRRLSFVRPGEDLVPADSYVPDALGLYQLRGNAAEMTATEGIAKGGSYREPAAQCAQGWTQPYTKPEPWLGFRCVARIRAR